ncbi:hypothetical protein CHGG_06268 [Chaetomium globosum CBS 148.51]|uniref:Fucose-specific lectin n=1 Tax=Chaetomium globosum (strain ATCC 6205 / CBS 148.51 / DSM 1962 / NBRC 6347 / NRRL 1970) TaxID=306901 RepID=Q2H4Z7_CHAGB|nr:uncharacterized protein CHGG_06268 [Chaetomium globosum CBS 148.51]EAQ89649.1 hypothetical protein CHGG_06268 [Chaetomium globosum CBS 148.51]
MAPLLSTLLLLGAAASPARASIAAWWTEVGPQIILQNTTTNQIRYSACNSRGQAKYSYTDASVFSLKYKPKVGTPVTGVGWYNKKETEASIWYITEQNTVANGLFICNDNTGRFEPQEEGNWVISPDTATIHSNTGLASVVLGQDTGYRVYYHDSDGAINELHYTRDTGWEHRGIISQDINSLPGLGVAFSGKGNITVAAPRDDQNIAVTRWNSDETWFRTTLPRPLDGGFVNGETIRADIALNETAETNFTLQAWDGKTKNIGVSIDNAYTRSLWYIGNDRNLYTVANQNYTWNKRASQSNAYWPQADEPNAELAVAYEFKSSMVRLYYTVNGQISEITYEDKTWKAWSALEAPPPPQATQSTTPSATNTAVASDTGLSTGAKAGIGVGVSLGVIALGAIIAVVVLARKRKQQALLQHPEDADEGSTTIGGDTPAPSYGSPALARASAAQYEQYGWDQKEAPTHP